MKFIWSINKTDNLDDFLSEKGGAKELAEKSVHIKDEVYIKKEITWKY